MRHVRALLLLALGPCINAWAQVRTAEKVSEQSRTDLAAEMELENGSAAAVHRNNDDAKESPA